jgi:molybdenum-dependent DNA-binding transcriptional regulator ModE
VSGPFGKAADALMSGARRATLLARPDRCLSLAAAGRAVGPSYGPR